MKSRLMILLAVMAIVSGGGCVSQMPDWALRAHVEGYNRLHPDTPVTDHEKTEVK